MRTGLERPPRWGILTLIALVVANIVVFAYLGLRDDPAGAAGSDPAEAASTTAASAASSAAESSAAGTAASSAASTGTTPATPPVLAVYGDGYASGNQQGGVGAAGWPALVAAQAGMTLSLHAVPQTGYATPGATNLTLNEIVTAEPVADAAVTVLFGSRNDQGAPAATVQANATAAITAVRAADPGGVLVVIGPVWSDAVPPAGLLAARDAVQAAATAADVAFLDPLTAGWFSTGTGLIAGDAVSPTDAGHQYLAQQIQPAVAAALRQAPA